MRAERLKARSRRARPQLPDCPRSRVVGKRNGELLDLAEDEFDVLVTLDTNLRYQQNLTGRKIAIVVLLAPSNRLIHLSPRFPACAEALKKIKPGDFVQVGA